MSASDFVLDSYALLAMLEDEPGSDRVAEIIGDTSLSKHMSVVNVGEVLYILARRRSPSAADEVINALRATEDIALVDVGLDRAAAAARLKAQGGLSYADCFAAALAEEMEGVLLTGDPEFSRAEHVIKIEWLN